MKNKRRFSQSHLVPDFDVEFPLDKIEDDDYDQNDYDDVLSICAEISSVDHNDLRAFINR